MKILGLMKRATIEIEGTVLSILIEGIETDSKLESLTFNDMTEVHARETRIKITGLILKTDATALADVAPERKRPSESA